jgi:hypothetical protein
MMAKKFLIVAFLMLLVFGIGALNVGYAMSITDYGRPEPGAENPAPADDTIGGRGTSVGFITPYQHGVVNNALVAAFEKGKTKAVALDATRIESDSVDPKVTASMTEGIKKYSLTAWSIDGLTDETSIDGHYGIRAGRVYVDSRAEGPVLQHELYELISLLDWAGKQGLTREQLVEKLKDPAFAEEAQKMLQGFHDENPYKLPERKAAKAPQHMPTLTVPPAIGNAVVAVLEVNDTSPAVITKAQPGQKGFFETNTNDAKILPIAATLILNNTVTPDQIYAYATTGEQRPIAILVENNIQKEEVAKIFEKAGASDKLAELENSAKLAMVDISFVQNLPGIRGAAGVTEGKNPFIEAAENLYKRGVDGCTLQNLNARLEEIAGTQV